MAAPHPEFSVGELSQQCDELARECELLTQERDDLQFELSWNEHTLDEIQAQLRAEHHAHAHAEHRVRALWGLLKDQTRRVRAIRQ